MVTMAGGSKHAVRDIVVTDCSSAIPVFVTAFDELAYKGSPLVSPGVHEFPVLGLSGLLTAYYKGFSLATGFITTVTTYPLGPHSDALRHWAASNKQVLLSRAEQLFATLSPRPPKAVCRITDLDEKSINGLQLGDRNWVRGFVQPITAAQISAYTGCSKCEGPTIVPIGCDYFCNFCVANNRKSTYFVTLDFRLDDGSGWMSLRARTEHAELLLRAPTPDIYNMKHKGDEAAVQIIIDKLGSSTLWFEITATQLNRGTPLLFWTLTSVEIPVVHMPTNFTLTPRRAQNIISSSSC